MEPDLDKKQQDARTKKRYEKGEGSRTVGISDNQVKKLFEEITMVAYENWEKVTQHMIGYFH